MLDFFFSGGKVGIGAAPSTDNLEVTGSIKAAGDIKTDSLVRASNVGGCYTRWGGSGCIAGFDAVLTGRPGGFEKFGVSDTGWHQGNVVCVSNNAQKITVAMGGHPNNEWTGYYNRFMRSDQTGNAMSSVDNTCTLCCRGGCYTAFGIDSCASGYTRAYKGHQGGVEAFHSNNRNTGDTLCIDDDAQAFYTWNPPSAQDPTYHYWTRLMRHKPPTTVGTQNGMDSVQTKCAVCCR
ncbi:MAG: hypothetical protein QF632_02150 [Candidatus Woesearchaeota archaeon]|nr:hypothetical protein [Candidatus Woesearchaeota archaeon]MDP7323542.1 hypothetical protein [Candidatus Woesearchaeota archaeon]